MAARKPRFHPGLRLCHRQSRLVGEWPAHRREGGPRPPGQRLPAAGYSHLSPHRPPTDRLEDAQHRVQTAAQEGCVVLNDAGILLGYVGGGAFEAGLRRPLIRSWRLGQAPSVPTCHSQKSRHICGRGVSIGFWLPPPLDSGWVSCIARTLSRSSVGRPAGRDDVTCGRPRPYGVGKVGFHSAGETPHICPSGSMAVLLPASAVAPKHRTSQAKRQQHHGR